MYIYMGKRKPKLLWHKFPGSVFLWGSTNRHCSLPSRSLFLWLINQSSTKRKYYNVCRFFFREPMKLGRKGNCCSFIYTRWTNGGILQPTVYQFVSIKTVEKWLRGFNGGWKRQRINVFNFCKPQKWSWCANSVQKLFSQRRTLAISALFLPTRHKNS